VQRLSLDQCVSSFQQSCRRWDTLAFLQVDDIQTRLGTCYHYSHTRKLLLSTLALADTEAATSYQLYTRFTSMLSLRYSHSPRITVEQLYFHTGVHNTFAFLL
jgi:hypothetical protein